MYMRYFTFSVANAKFTRQYKAQKWNKSFAHIEHRVAGADPGYFLGGGAPLTD